MRGGPGGRDGNAEEEPAVALPATTATAAAAAHGPRPGPRWGLLTSRRQATGLLRGHGMLG
jgi:hypothetical protein